MHFFSNARERAIAVRAQDDWSEEFWIGVIERYSIGPVILTNRLNSKTGLEFLQNTLPNLFDEVHYH